MNINVCEHKLKSASNEASSILCLLRIIEDAINEGVIIDNFDLALALGGVRSLAHNLHSNLFEFTGENKE